MYLFFLILNLLLLIFCKDDQEYMDDYDYVFFYFISILIKIYHLYFITCIDQNFLCTCHLQRLVTYLFYLYCHFDIFAALISSKVLWHILVLIVTLRFLIYLSSPKSCNIFYFLLWLWGFWCTYSLQSLVTYFSSYCHFEIFDVLILSIFHL